MAGRATSAAYRLPTPTSTYHEKCIAVSVRAIQEASARSSGDKTYPATVYRNCNAVIQEKIWSEHCHKETKTSKNWDKNWGFLTEYDLKGDPNPKKQLPEKVSYYGTAVPPTSSKHVGSRVGSSNSKQIYHLEMMTCHRKKRSGLENCYC